MGFLRSSSNGSALWIACTAAVSASACWLVAGTDDFSDEPAAGGNSATSSASGASGGQGGAQTSTGAQGGVGGTAGSGGQGGQGGAPCPPGSDKPNGECCNDFGECSSTFCADGICCDTVCAQSCFSCGEMGSLGTCVDACITVTFGENIADDFNNVTDDNHLQEANPSTNRGTSSLLRVGPSPTESALLRFDVSALPPGAAIGESIIYLYVVQTTSPALGIYEVLEDWDEITSTWANRFANFQWSVPGAGPSSSSSAVAFGSFAATVSNQYVLRTIDHNLVQRWFDNPSTNFGVVIRAAPGPATSPAHFSSSDGVEGEHPYLQVKYRP